MVQAVQQSLPDQRILQGDRTWEQFQWIRQGFDNAPGVKLFYYLTRCVLMAQTSRLEAVKAFRQGIQPTLN